MRRGKEFYSQQYDDAIGLYDSGVPIKEIARRLKLSYSCVYHWVKGLRKPKSGNVTDFVDFLKKNGPTASVELADEFPKHNELFHTASKRGLKVKRHALGRKYGEYSTWYFLEGQEDRMKKRVNRLFDKINEVREKLKSAIE